MHVQTCISGTFSPRNGVESPPRAAGKIVISHLFGSGSKSKKSPAGSSTGSPAGLLLTPQPPKREESSCLSDGKPVETGTSLCGDPPQSSLSQSETDGGTRVNMRWMLASQPVPYL